MRTLVGGAVVLIVSLSTLTQAFVLPTGNTQKASPFLPRRVALDESASRQQQPSLRSVAVRVCMVWTQHRDPDSGKTFFYNPKTRQSVWTKPPSAELRKGDPSAGSVESNGNGGNETTAQAAAGVGGVVAAGTAVRTAATGAAIGSTVATTTTLTTTAVGGASSQAGVVAAGSAARTAAGAAIGSSLATSTASSTAVGGASSQVGVAAAGNAARSAATAAAAGSAARSAASSAALATGAVGVCVCVCVCVMLLITVCNCLCRWETTF